MAMKKKLVLPERQLWGRRKGCVCTHVQYMWCVYAACSRLYLMWVYGVWQVYNVHKCSMFYSICMFHEMHVMCVCVQL